MDTKKGLTVQVQREFPVPADALYRAWNEPEALKQWWTPMNRKLEHVTNELREGGTIEYRTEESNGAPSLIINGTYEEVKERERLVYSWVWHLTDQPVEDSPYRLTIGFSDSNGKSRLDVNQENLKDDEAIRIHQEGWESALDSLERYLTSKGN